MSLYRHNTLGGDLLFKEVERQSLGDAQVLKDHIDKETVEVIKPAALPENNLDYAGRVRDIAIMAATPENQLDDPNRLKNNAQVPQGFSSGLDRPVNNNFAGRHVITPDYAVLANGKDTETKPYPVTYSNSPSNPIDNVDARDNSEFQEPVYTYTKYVEVKDLPQLDFEDPPFHFTNQVEKVNTKVTDFF